MIQLYVIERAPLPSKESGTWTVVGAAGHLAKAELEKRSLKREHPQERYRITFGYFSNTGNE